MFSTKRELAHALLDGRRFKDKAGNEFMFSGNVDASPFRVKIDGYWGGLSNTWDNYNELVEIFDNPKLAVDTKVLVSDDCDSTPEPAHFKRFDDDGVIVTFCGGQTSHTTGEKSSSRWHFWKVVDGTHKGKNNFKTTKEK